LACIEHGVAAPLVAPFKPRDADLYAIVSAFEGIYAGYSEFQSNIERYWCLRWLAQQKAHRMEAAVLKDEVVRLTEIPLVLKLAGLQQLARGTQVQLDILNWDEISLEVEARLHLVSTGTTQGATELLVPLNDDDEINTIDSVNAVTEPLAVDDTVQQSVAH
ncbi:MAG: RNB domain-containing ribonuclease, partial [Herbaspirillum sp.]